ncbi:MAG TPA: Mut7-C RNAse domain-containing protein [Ignavibacteriaceae bacterium]|nr:Mut7-C RNAse domain-containing protein [Ignavibacteriaceae bacterium]
MKTAYFRFYEELNDFLPEEKRKKMFEHSFAGKNSVKDMIESLGVPHIEIDLILVNGISVDFNYIVREKDEITVYPVFESFDISGIQHLREKPLRTMKFITDVHLGALTKYMRMLGLDTVYKNDYHREDIIKISVKEKRVILTKDRELLKRNEITHGYWIRSNKIEEQLKELIERFHLKNEINEFARCLICNTQLINIDKKEVQEKIPPKVNEHQNEFYYCSNCNKIYWKGTHYEKMRVKINGILKSMFNH